MLREIIRMGDPRLLRIAPPVTEFDAALHELVADMFETMDAAGGVGLAAPQIAVDLQLMVFGFEQNHRYPDAPPVPRTALANVEITPLRASIRRTRLLLMSQIRTLSAASITMLCG